MTKKTKPVSNEKLFFEYIEARVANLAKAYSLALEDLGDFNLLDLDFEKISAEIDNEIETNKKINISYNLVLTRLNRSINSFKKEMRLCLQDYYMLMTIGGLNQNAANHIQNKLNELHKEYKILDKNISEDILKKGLGSNYHFHKNLKKLTVKSIMNYFETNYLLHTEKEKED